MKFVKRLVILSGERGKGTLNLERNAYGVFVKINAFGGGLYSFDLVMNIDGKVFTRRLTRENSGFSLNGLDSVDVVQAAVFEDGRLAMFGTNEPRRLSASEALHLKAYIKKDKELEFTTRSETESRLIRLPSREETVKKEVDKQQASSVFLESSLESKLEYRLENRLESSEDENYREAEAEAQKSEAEYQDEQLADADFYPKEVDYDALGNIAEEKIRSIKTEMDDFLNDYKVSPSAMERDFLTEAIKYTAAHDDIPTSKKPSLRDAAQQGFVQKEYIKQSSERQESINRDSIRQGFKQSSTKLEGPQESLSLFGESMGFSGFKPRQKESPRQDEAAIFKVEKGTGQREAAAAVANFGAERSDTKRGSEGLRGGGRQDRRFAGTKSGNSASGFNTGRYGGRDSGRSSERDSGRNSEKYNSDHSSKEGKPEGGGTRVSALNSGPHINARGATFFERNGDEIEKLFKGPREQELEKLLPGSRWVKINYDKSGRYYVIGLIGKEFLCYGVPADYSPYPPEELKGYCWWLPAVPDKPEGKGYWIMYQNLISGETIYPE